MNIGFYKCLYDLTFGFLLDYTSIKARQKAGMSVALELLKLSIENPQLAEVAFAVQKKLKSAIDRL